MHRQRADAEWTLTLLNSKVADAERHLAVLLGKAYEPDPAVDQVISLSRVNFACKEGEFVVLVGEPGSGASTFLHALLGGVKTLSGSVALEGSVAYHPQVPFVKNDTVKNNIMLGSEATTSDGIYKQALGALGLQDKLEQLDQDL